MHTDMAEELMNVTTPTQIFTKCWSLLALNTSITITFNFFGMEAKMLFQTQGCPLQTSQVKIVATTLLLCKLCTNVLFVLKYCNFIFLWTCYFEMYFGEVFFNTGILQLPCVLCLIGMQHSHGAQSTLLTGIALLGSSPYMNWTFTVIFLADPWRLAKLRLWG